MNPRKEYWYQTQPNNGMRRQGSSLQHGGPPIANSRQKPSGVGDLLQNWSGPRDAPPPLQRKSSAVRPRNPFKRKPSIIEVSDLNNPGNIETTQVPYWSCAELNMWFLWEHTRVHCECVSFCENIHVYNVNVWVLIYLSRQCNSNFERNLYHSCWQIIWCMKSMCACVRACVRACVYILYIAWCVIWYSNLYFNGHETYLWMRKVSNCMCISSWYSTFIAL